MDNKAYTILVSSNRRGKTRAFTVSAAWLKASLAIGCILAVIGSVVTLDYIGLLLQSAENKKLKAESIHLRRQFRLVESKLGTLEKSLDRVKNFSKKLRLITNVEDEDRSLKLSMGPNPSSPSGRARSFLGIQGSGNAQRSYVGDHGGYGQAVGAPGAQRKMASVRSSNALEDALFINRAPLDRLTGELSRSNGRDYGTLSIRIDRSVKDTQLTEQGVLALYDALSERQSLLNATPNIKPTRGWFTSQFGYRLDPFTGKPQMHNGLDLAAAPGTPVYAPAHGVVSYVGYERGYGNLVSIDHGFGVVTRFAHNSQVFVEVGDKINRRQVIAAVGSTGRSSGPHLHYEVRVHGVPVDPMNYILGE